MSVATLSVTDIVVYRPFISADAAQTETLTIEYRGRARIQPLSGREQALYGRDTARVTTKAYVTGSPDIRSDDIVHANGGAQVYLVRAVRDIDLLGRFTTLELEEQK